MLDKNKKLYGNLANIISESKRAQSFSKKYENESIDRARNYMRRNKQRARVTSLLNIEKQNSEMAKKIARA